MIDIILTEFFLNYNHNINFVDKLFQISKLNWKKFSKINYQDQK